MEQERFVSITISLPKYYRDQLRKMAAETSLRNPDEFTSISQLGREILCEHLKEIAKKSREN
jgi:hypothetical protein